MVYRQLTDKNELHLKCNITWKRFSVGYLISYFLSFFKTKFEKLSLFLNQI